MPPVPVSLLLPGRGMIPIDIGAMVLFPIHMVGAIFIGVPLMVVPMMRVVVTLVVMIILSHQAQRHQQRSGYRHTREYLFHNLEVLQPIKLDTRSDPGFRGGTRKKGCIAAS